MPEQPIFIYLIANWFIKPPWTKLWYCLQNSKSNKWRETGSQEMSQTQPICVKNLWCDSDAILSQRGHIRECTEEFILLKNLPRWCNNCAPRALKNVALENIKQKRIEIER